MQIALYDTGGDYVQPEDVTELLHVLVLAQQVVQGDDAA